MEKESKRHLGRKLSYLQLSDKYGLARKRAGLPPLGGGRNNTNSENDPSKLVEISGAEAVDIDEIEKSEDVLARMRKAPVELCSLTRLDARMAQVDTQPETVDGLFPIHKHLMIKRSQRCRKCEHNLSKPEYNPTSIKFKIQLAAFYHVPEVTIFRNGGPWLPGAEGKFMLKITNPTQHSTSIEFLNASEIEKFKEEAAKNKQEPPRPLGSLLRVPSLIQASSDRHSVNVTALSTLPTGTKVFLPPRDDAAEFDDTGPDMKGHIDDKNVVAWRKGNKVGVVLSATPEMDNTTEDVVVSFGLKFLYTNTVSALEQREIQTAYIVIPIYINLGPLGK